MTLYLIPKPPDKLGRKNRESGWRHVPFDRQARKEIEDRVEPLRDKGITAVYSSDLDTKYAEIIRDHIDIPTVRPEFHLRRFNVGKLHTADRSIVDEQLRNLSQKWAKNKDIPVRGGDSLTSFEKRFIKRYKQILAEQGTAAMIVDERTLSVIRDLSTNKYGPTSLVPNGSGPAMDRIYKVEPIARA